MADFSFFDCNFFVKLIIVLIDKHHDNFFVSESFQSAFSVDSIQESDKLLNKFFDFVFIVNVIWVLKIFFRDVSFYKLDFVWVFLNELKSLS